MAKEKKQYIYFILNKDKNIIKIGKSWNPEARIKEIANDVNTVLSCYGMQETKLELLASIIQSQHLKEEDFHNIFDDDLIAGEWYRTSPKLLNLVDEIQSNEKLQDPSNYMERMQLMYKYYDKDQ